MNTQAVLWLGVMATLASCASAPPATKPTPPPPKPSAVSVPSVAQKAPSPIELAAVYAEQAKERLDNAANHPELNGYFELIKIPAAKYGTVKLYDVYKKNGRKALLDAVRSGAGKTLEPFIGQMRKIQGIAGYQYLTVPVKVPPTGPLVPADDSKFVDVLKGLALSPTLDFEQAKVDPEYGSGTDYAALTIQVGRKISYQAGSLQHLSLGLDLQSEGLSIVGELLESGDLSPAKLRDLIADLQSVAGNEKDFLRVADAEYLAALRRYQSRGLTEPELRRESTGLAARHLKMRPLFENHGHKPADIQVVPEAKDCKLLSKQPDLLAAYHRWRMVTNRLSALELLAALELYKLENKTYPARLDALLGKYLTRLPRDYFSRDGQFFYELAGQEAKLQSVSPDIPDSKEGRYRWQPISTSPH